MSGIFLLDWAALAISLAITMLLVWLSLVVWLVSEQRTWGIHLTSSGLLLGAYFFIVHSVLLAQADNLTNPWLEVWWKVGWVPLILSPFSWYLVVLWYVGFWESPHSALHRRQRPFLFINSLLTTFLLLFLLVDRSLPTYIESLRLDFTNVTLRVFGIPALIVALPIFILFCLGLAVDALLRPGPTRRPMADLARARARPWLLASSLLLVVVSLLVGLVLMRLLVFSHSGMDSAALLNFMETLSKYDLLIALVTGSSILCLGQALVSYEIFTGKALPRQGLRQYYYSAILLFGGISLLLAGAYIMQISAIYSLLLALLITTAYFALLSWRSLQERDWAIRQLRPFVASQKLYEQIISSPAEYSTTLDIHYPFNALCSEVLGTRKAALIATGPLGPLVNQPLVYPQDTTPVLPDFSDFSPQFTSPDVIAIPLDTIKANGYAWAIPLWSERGLIGILLLGEKSSRGFYTQEEIEVARASGERLVDAQAGIEIIRRMRDLQREQMVSAQVIDRRTRRTLHDEILPALHTIILKLTSPATGEITEVKNVVQELADIHRHTSSLLRELPAPMSPDIQRRGLLAALRHLVQVDLAGLFDRTVYIQADNIEPTVEAFTGLTADVLFYASREAIRNAAQHARGHQPLNLKVTVSNETGFQIMIEDDGVGMLPTINTGEIKTGQGLALHSTLMAIIGGSLTVETKPAEYTRVILKI